MVVLCGSRYFLGLQRLFVNASCFRLLSNSITGGEFSKKDSKIDDLFRKKSLTEALTSYKDLFDRAFFPEKFSKLEKSEIEFLAKYLVLDYEGRVHVDVLKLEKDSESHNTIPMVIKFLTLFFRIYRPTSDDRINHVCSLLLSSRAFANCRGHIHTCKKREEISAVVDESISHIDMTKVEELEFKLSKYGGESWRDKLIQSFRFPIVCAKTCFQDGKGVYAIYSPDNDLQYISEIREYSDLHRLNFAALNYIFNLCEKNSFLSVEIQISSLEAIKSIENYMSQKTLNSRVARPSKPTKYIGVIEKALNYHVHWVHLTQEMDSNIKLDNMLKDSISQFS